MTTRRVVLKSLLATSAVAVFAGNLAGIRALASNTVPKRRSLHGMALDDPDLETYRDFVAILQGRNQSQPVSWLSYSLLHGNADTGQFRYCPHGDWYFLPWHRAYVSMYEQAARELTGNPAFAMPYWDWTVDRTVPAAFTDPSYKGQPNPLFVPNRTLATSNWPLKDQIVGPQVMDAIYRETDFQAFGTSKNPAQNDLNMRWVVAGGGVQGTLERTPHNNVHNFIGAFMPTAGSPRDPIFMMHHSNIDRVWACWNALGRSNTSGMDQRTQQLWLEMEYTNNFLSATGVPYSKKTKDVQDTYALGYTYENLPQADRLRFDEERSRRLAQLFALGAHVDRVEGLSVLPDVPVEPALLDRPMVKQFRLHESMRRLVVEERAADARRPEVLALIRGIEHTANIEALRVFVNADRVTAETPVSDPHFVTQIGFLEHGEHAGHGDHGKEPVSVVVDLTDALQGLSERGLLRDDTISVQLLPILRHGRTPERAQLLPAAVEIAVL